MWKKDRGRKECKKSREVEASRVNRYVDVCALCTVVGLLFKEVGGIETGIQKTENPGSREEERRPACFKVEASKMLALKGFLSIFRKLSRLVVPPT